MEESTSRKPPLPLVQSFVACNEIFQDRQTNRTLLIGPTSHVPLEDFPAHVRLSLFVELTGGHGHYLPRLCLRDNTEEVVWGWTAKGPIAHHDPLSPHQVMFRDLIVVVPRPGRYTLVMLLNEEEFAQRSMWFGPMESSR